MKKGNLTIDEYILKMKGYADNLLAAGQSLSDEEFILYILGGLGNEYESVVVNLTSRKDGLNLQEVQFMLENQENRIEQNLGHLNTDSYNLSANYVNYPPRNNMNQRNHNNYARNNFNSQGFSGNQRSNQYYSQRGRSNRGGGRVYRGRGRFNNYNNKVICQVCGSPGHTAIKCFRRFDENFQGYNGNNSYNNNSSSNSQAYYASSDQNYGDSAWYMDSGASNHVTSDMCNLSIQEDYKGSDRLSVGNGSQLDIKHTGSTTIHSSRPLHLKNILHVPQITKNLVSISQFTLDNRVIVEFSSNCCLVKDQNTKKVLLQGTLKNGLYQLDLPSKDISKNLSCYNSVLHKQSSCHSSSSTNSLAYDCNSKTSNAALDVVQIWHNKLGHPCDSVLQKVLTSINIPFGSKHTSFCNACKLRKLHQSSFPSSSVKTTKPFEIVHSDVWGPSPQSSFEGFNYYLHFVDDFTRFTWIFPLKHKSDVKTYFLQFNAIVERQYESHIKCLQTDWGGEYRTLSSICSDLGILFRHSCPHTHQQAGRAERKHLHIIEMALSLLAQARMPMKFWWDACMSATYLINRLPTPCLNNSSPFQMLFHRVPDYHFLKVFGCSCFSLPTTF
jgi:histone deacetylase 1/2